MPSDESDTKSWDTESWTVMSNPRKVVAEERDRGNGNPPRVHVRVWHPDKERYVRRSLGMTVRDEQGQIDANQVNTMLNQAKNAGYDLLQAIGADVRRPHGRSAPRPNLTLEEGFRLALRPKDLEGNLAGKYRDNRHKREVERAVEDIKRVLAPSRTWSSLTMTDYQRLWEEVAKVRTDEEVWRSTKLKAQDEDSDDGGGDGPEDDDEKKGKKRNPGWRWARKMVSTLLAIGRWLEDEGKLPSGTLAQPNSFKRQLKEDWSELTNESLRPDKPRFKEEAFRKLWNALPKADPRLRLALQLGAELRLGQVLRARRSHLTLGSEGALEMGTFEVVGRGPKEGATVHLTRTQRKVVNQMLGLRGTGGNATSSSPGYLADLERAYRDDRREDYPLFPQYAFTNGTATAPADAPSEPMSRRTMLDLFYDLEKKAGVEHKEGRGWYGLRRKATDLAPEYTKDDRVLNTIGGWADSRTRESYQEEGNPVAGARAAQVRQKMRRELREGTDDEDSGSSIAADLLLLADPENFAQMLPRLAEEAPEAAAGVLKTVADDGLEEATPETVFRELSVLDLSSLLHGVDSDIRKSVIRCLNKFDGSGRAG